MTAVLGACSGLLYLLVVLDENDSFVVITAGDDVKVVLGIALAFIC